ncbi:MAG TPA: DNA translocase FtsK 4TM domain-containing protein [Acidimicrobiia bacterium]|nr:DNA translocase FtsK 4TM domain-containing protein [Acidimicrobiia bacterium]
MPSRKSSRNGRGGTSRSTKTTAPPPKRSLLAALRERIRNGFGRHTDDLWGAILLVAGLLVGLSFFGLAGPVGRGIVSGFRLAFGIWGYAVAPALLALGVLLLVIRHREDFRRIVLGFTVTFASSLAMFHLMTGTVSLAESLDLVRDRGGAVGSLLAFPLRRLIGFWGAFTVLVAFTALGVLMMTRTTVREALRTLRHAIAAGWHRLRTRPPRRRKRRPVVEIRSSTPTPAGRPRLVVVNPDPVPVRAATPAPSARPAPAPVIKPPPAAKPSAPTEARRDPKPGYKLPPLELLALGGGAAHNKKLLDDTAQELEEALLQHGVDARLTRIVPGPTVTRYEIELAPGVKVARITSLSHDIAYALATPDVRILAPIPGKSAIGVEVPNRRRQLVTLGDILRSPEAKEATHPLSVALGMDVSGRPHMLNLSELPHVLIAGATGAGKSSCINAIVTSLLVRTTPEEVRLILVDPKRVELGQYNDVPHLLTRVITNPKKAADALQWAVREMDLRYDLLAESGVRDISGYHEKFDRGMLEGERFIRFPYIVIVVDELNDLMMVAGRAVEDAIVRIAQMARAVGIHLVIATQRPSVDVITGVIKANIPSRLAFSVASQADSRVILDLSGAEKLIGLGDMIVVTARDPKAERIQGAWVSEDEVHTVVNFVREQRRAQYEESVFEAAEAAAKSDDEFEGEDADVIRQAIDIVVRSQLGSTSMLQRKLRIGFSRAGRVMDILERRGIVGPSEGSKAREVLLTVEELDEMLGESVDV